MTTAAEWLALVEAARHSVTAKATLMSALTGIEFIKCLRICAFFKAAQAQEKDAGNGC